MARAGLVGATSVRFLRPLNESNRHGLAGDISLTEKITLTGQKVSALQIALERARDPTILSLALGLPAGELFPSHELSEAAEVTLRDGAAVLQYGLPERRLKDHVVQLMHCRGVECTHEEIFLTAGAQQGLSLVAQMLLSQTNKKTILLEEAVYPGFLQAVEPHASQMIRVPTDMSSGIDIETARYILREGAHPAFLYTMSVGHNPLALTMTRERQQELADLAARHCLPIIEDDVYGFLQYDGRPVAPLISLNRDWVFYVGSFSKILAPALRVGWIVAPKKYMTTFSVLKEGCDINTGTLSQRIVCRYLDSHSLPDHIEYLQSQYRDRRNAMHEALLRHFQSQAVWKPPSAGFFFWLQSDTFGDTTALLEEALAKRVAFVPGEAFCPENDARYKKALRLNFSCCPANLIDTAVDRMALAVHERNERLAASYA
jgi:2-aminoadipate transaminase